MLKFLLSALFIIGLCGCDDHHIKKANEEYKDLMDKGNAPLEIHKVENEDALQHVIISSPYGTRGVLVKMKMRPDSTRFHTSSGIFVPYWFKIDLMYGHLVMSFTEETVYESKVVITWSLFRLTMSDAQENVLQLQPIPEDKLDRMLSIQPGSGRIHTTLSITWIKVLFEKGKPLKKDATKTRSPMQYLGKPVTIKDEVFGKLEQLYWKMFHSIFSEEFVDEGTTSDV